MFGIKNKVYKKLKTEKYIIGNVVFIHRATLINNVIYLCRLIDYWDDYLQLPQADLLVINRR